MNYTPTVWSNGMKITATRMNKLETNIADLSSPSIVSLTADSNGDTECTFNTVRDAFLSGSTIIETNIDNNYEYYYPVYRIGYYNDGTTYNKFYVNSSSNSYIANSASSYLSIDSSR